ncbi:hypothetical protein L3C95_30880 [Chitinophaga filiformis]|uniref:hypothetical protein n=1 Tax=Chitinophaga filiformis TaxID=104663 RepID=UPI001F30C186|nr:hypothetical protein [Chitinophaga filiformis]MCF6407340.1 hypothetical protein [Chitinophaga filiformis]
MRFKLFTWIKRFWSSQWVAPFILFMIPASILTVSAIRNGREQRALLQRGVYVIARITKRGKPRKGVPYADVVYAYKTRQYTAWVNTEHYSRPRTGDYVYLRILPDKPETVRLVEHSRVPDCMVALARYGQSWNELPSCNTPSSQHQVIFIPAGKEQPFLKDILQDSSMRPTEYITAHHLSGQLVTIKGENIVGIRSFVKGRTSGEELQSFEGGSIHHYVLRADSVNATFFRTYTSSGKIWHEEGTPIIHREVRSFRDGSVEIKLVVADRIFRDMVISCSVGEEKYTETKLADDSTYWPYRVCHITVNVSRKQARELILEVQCEDKYTEEQAVFRDTLTLAAYSRHR